MKPIAEMTIEEAVSFLRAQALEKCVCTERQQSGEDSTVCQHCEASEMLNRIGEMLRGEI